MFVDSEGMISVDWGGTAFCGDVTKRKSINELRHGNLSSRRRYEASNSEDGGAAVLYIKNVLN